MKIHLQLFLLSANKQINKCVSRLARRKFHHRTLRDASAPNYDCPPSVAAGFDICLKERTLVIRILFHRSIHQGSNAAAPVTPREPKFTKRGEDLSG